MFGTLEEYLQRSGKSKHDMAADIEKTERTIRDWLHPPEHLPGNYHVDYDGRTFQVNFVTCPGRLVYVRGRERPEDV